MKKIIASIPLLLLLLTSCDKKDENATFQNDLKTYNLNGKVKSIQEKSYEIVGGDAKGNLKRENSATFDTELEFDLNKQLISEKSFLSDGKLIKTRTFENKSKLLSEDEFLPNDVVYKTKYTFDKGNNTIISKRDKEGRQIYKTVNTFEKGLLTQKRLFDKSDQLMERFTYKYDKKGNLIEATLQNDYEVLYKDVYEYDTKNNKVSEARLDRSNTPAYKIATQFKDSLITEIKSYDSKGNLISLEKRNYDSKGNIESKSLEDLENKEYSKEAFKYDSAGNLVQWMQSVQDQKPQIINYQYDDQKNLVHLQRIDNEGNVQENRKYAYEYDEQGNWIKKSIINNDTQTFVIERKIQYY
ncbi:RHS repeat domain-containing protein [Flavobacterium macacae]|uniref:Teneurin-like YD-shell domain-containing protein n=1 Tax=Flavobacterium macacae TaxID=2488993 RepID=A0A3P3W6F7_9FLAO|nr:hypothetical protein [Flavobacterium macacae]RRJ89229.1 hypothetical protein EG849_13245 [Flavobacterium macacae]